MNHLLNLSILSALSDYFTWWQGVLFLVLLGLIAVFFVIRKKQQ